MPEVDGPLADHPRVKGWIRFLGKRLFSEVVSIWGICTIAFFAVRFVGNPIAMLAGPDPTPVAMASVRSQLGLDHPVIGQYLVYLGGLFRGNLGHSAVSGLAVTSELAQYLPATLELLVAALFLAVVATIVLAVLGARNRRGVAARIGNVLIQGGSSVPVFWLGLLLVYVFYYILRWAPAPLGQVNPNLTVPSGPTHFLFIDSLISGNWTVVASALAYLVLPAVSLSLSLLPTLLQTTRSTIEEVLDSSYIKTMQACGLASWRLYIRYVLRNSLVPFINVLAMTFGYAVGGAVLVEEVFQWPGVGFYAVSSMTSSDYAPVVGIVLVSAIINVTLYNIADVVSAIIDPRITL